MINKTSQKGYYDSFEDFDAIELGVVDGRENEYRERFISRRAEKMAKIADLDDESTILEVGCGTGIYTNLSLKKKALPKKHFFYGLRASSNNTCKGCEVFHVHGGFGKGAGKDSVDKSVGGGCDCNMWGEGER